MSGAKDSRKHIPSRGSKQNSAPARFRGRGASQLPDWCGGESEGHCHHSVEDQPRIGVHRTWRVSTGWWRCASRPARRYASTKTARRGSVGERNHAGRRSRHEPMGPGNEHPVPSSFDRVGPPVFPRTNGAASRGAAPSVHPCMSDYIRVNPGFPRSDSN